MITQDFTFIHYHFDDHGQIVFAEEHTIPGFVVGGALVVLGYFLAKICAPHLLGETS